MPFRLNPFTRKLDIVDITTIPPGAVDSLSGNTGGNVGPDASNDIFVLGSAPLTVTGNPGTNTLTISIDGTAYVSSITGTANQISASAAFGAVTLSFPSALSLGSYQATTPGAGISMIMPGFLCVGTTANVDAAAYLTVNTSTTAAAGAWIVGNNASGPSLFIRNSAANTWAIRSNGASDTGGANALQFSNGFGSGNFFINSTTGVIAARTNGMALGNTFYTAAPPANGLIVEGQFSGGSSSVAASIGAQFAYTNAAQVAINGTVTAKTTVITAADQAALRLDTVLNPTGGSAGLINGIANLVSFVAPTATTISSAAAYTASYTAGANVGTISNLIGYYANGGLASAGTIDNHYSAYFNTPGSGTNRIGIYAGNMAVGVLGTQPPSNGAIILGHTLVGTTIDVTNTRFIASMNAADGTGIYITGTSNGVNASGKVTALDIVPTLQPTGGLPGNVVAGLSMRPTYIATAATTIAAVHGINITSVLTSNAGTISEYDGIYIYNSTGAGTITLARGLGVEAVTSGTSNICAAFQGGICVGTSYFSTVPPTNGAIIQGVVGIGTSSPDASIKLQVGSTSDTTANAIRISNANSANANPVQSFFVNGAQENVIALENGFLLFAINPASYTTANLQSAGKVAIGPSGGLCVGSSYINSTPPTNGAIIEGQVGIGSSSPGGYMLQIVPPDTTAFSIGAGVGGAIRGTAGLITANDQAGLFCAVNLKPSGTINYVMQQYIYPVVNASLATATTIPVSIGLLIYDGALTSGTVTTSYGAWIRTPSFGTTRCALFTENLSIGYSGTAPPSSGAIIQGVVGIGTSSVTSSVRLDVVAATTDVTNIYVRGTLNAVSSNRAWGILLESVINPTNGASNYTAGLGCTPSFVSPSAQTIALSAGLYVGNTLSANVGTITLAAGVYIDAGTTSSGTVTASYGLYVKTPNTGPSTRRCAFFESAIVYNQSTTGAGSASLGANSPAVTNTAPYTWLTFVSSDGSVVYVPAWK